MTPEEMQLVNGLCKRIADEKDPFTFRQLVEQLDALLARKEKRLNEQRRGMLRGHHRDSELSFASLRIYHQLHNCREQG
jgi:hypothetical protein